MDDHLTRGRQAIEERAWGDVYTLLSIADSEGSLSAEDLEWLGVAAYLVGNDDAAVDAWERAFHAFAETGEVGGAVRAAFWLVLDLVLLGRHAQGGGWLARGQRLIEQHEVEIAEQGYLLGLIALRMMEEGDAASALEALSRAVEIADRFDSPDVSALGRLGSGQALIRMGRVDDGVALLDAAMLEVIAERTSPIVTGVVYCAVILTCVKIFDFERAWEWTRALDQWSAGQAGLTPFRGQCLVHRSQLRQFHGDWADALEEADRARRHMATRPSDPAIGMAYYQEAELQRLRGRLEEAEEGYRQASQWGHSPYPGLALLRLAQGRVEAAQAAIRRVLVEEQDRSARATMLGASVRIMLAAGEVESARAGADELSEIAVDFEAPFLRATAIQARGSVLIAEGEFEAALVTLREAWELWHELEAAYEIAQARVLIGEACRALGDEDSAILELETARDRFIELGAVRDLTHVDALLGRPAHGLTPREHEVLRLLSTGMTNKEIPARLYISERTVDRHVSNILTKLRVPSRAAATAYAYQHDLV